MNHQKRVHRAVIALAVVVSAMVSGAAWGTEPPANPPKADCSCAAAFERVVERTETRYVAFSIKVDAERREAYDRFKAILRKDAGGAGVVRCQEVLKTYLAFFQDHHLFVLGNSEAGGVKEAARPWTEAEARAELDRHRERLDPVEGLWYSRAGRFAVLHEPGAPAGTFIAVRLAKDGMPSKEMAAVLRRIAHGSYQISSWDAQGKWQTSVAGLYRGGALLGFGAQSWGRLYPEVLESRLDPVDPMAPLFARLNANTLYLSFPSFFGEYEQALNDLLQARGTEIGKADGLIIDLRGNGGGNAIYYGLVPYLFTGPFEYREDNLILASPDNLQWLEEARKGMSDEDGADFDPALRRMRENPGKLVPYLEAKSYTPPVVSPGPRRVVLLTDRGVGSAGEGMVLDARESPRVTIVGENTRGNIDYQNAFINLLGCGEHTYALGIPRFTRTRQLPLGGLDNIGITPDVPVPDHLGDPLAFALRLLAEP